MNTPSVRDDAPRKLARESRWSGEEPKNSGPCEVEVGGRIYVLTEGGAASKLGLWLWPASVVLAKEMAKRSWAGLTVLELGAGLGLAGMVAASRGGAVTFCETDQEVATRLRDVLAQNDLSAEVLNSDWRNVNGAYDTVIGSEMLHYRRVAELLATVDKLWTGKGPIMFADHGDVNVPMFRRTEAEDKLMDGRLFRCDLWTLT